MHNFFAIFKKKIQIQIKYIKQKVERREERHTTFVYLCGLITLFVCFCLCVGVQSFKIDFNLRETDKHRAKAIERVRVKERERGRDMPN